MAKPSDKPLLYNAQFKVYWNRLGPAHVYAQNLNIGSLRECTWQTVEWESYGDRVKNKFYYRRHTHGLIQLLREVGPHKGGVHYVIDKVPVWCVAGTSGDWNANNVGNEVVRVDVDGLGFLMDIRQLNPYLDGWKIVKCWSAGQDETLAVPRLVQHPMNKEFETWSKYLQKWTWVDYAPTASDSLPTVFECGVRHSVRITQNDMDTGG